LTWVLKERKQEEGGPKKSRLNWGKKRFNSSGKTIWECISKQKPLGPNAGEGGGENILGERVRHNMDREQPDIRAPKSTLATSSREKNGGVSKEQRSSRGGEGAVTGKANR